MRCSNMPKVQSPRSPDVRTRLPHHLRRQDGLVSPYVVMGHRAETPSIVAVDLSILRSFPELPRRMFSSVSEIETRTTRSTPHLSRASNRFARCLNGHDETQSMLRLGDLPLYYAPGR